MKRHILAYGTIILAILWISSEFVYSIDMSRESGDSNVEHNVSESYLINIPSKITLNYKSNAVFSGTASVSASVVRLKDGETLAVSMKTDSGVLKKEVGSIISKVPYSISVNGGVSIEASNIVYSYMDIFTIKAGETDRMAVLLELTTSSVEYVKMVGAHKDVLTFKVDIIGGTKYMQDIESLKDTFTGDDVEQKLVDARDNKEYYVAKLADDNIWMVQNLDYVPTGATWSWTGDGIDANNDDKIYASGDASITGGTDAHFSHGAYYGWNAAKEVCPAGWTLPSKAQFEGLLLSEGITKNSIINSPFYALYVGAAKSTDYIGVDGHYWSSTERTDVGYVDAYELHFSDFGLSLTYNSIQSGFSVRCIAE